MTNSEIIQAECNVRGIEEEVNTFAYWKKIGYRVKQGEHALFETRLWKKRMPKSPKRARKCATAQSCGAVLPTIIRLLPTGLKTAGASTSLWTWKR